MRVIMFIFGGREANIRLALPYYERILRDNPDTDIHLWDLARNPADSKYMRSITGIDRLTVRTEFTPTNGKASRAQTRVWRYYAGPGYQDCMFFKGDDDLAFLETNRFADFIDTAARYPKHVVSALTVNNGASTPHIPALAQWFLDSDIPLRNDSLLDVHLSADYAEACHQWFITNWQTLIDSQGLIPTTDWVSINAIAMTHSTLQRIARLLDTQHPKVVAGRQQRILGDEGAANMQPRIIHKGFIAGHLTFGPQCDPKRPEREPGVRILTPNELTKFRKGYADIAEQYLCPASAS